MKDFQVLEGVGVADRLILATWFAVDSLGVPQPVPPLVQRWLAEAGAALRAARMVYQKRSAHEGEA